MTQDNDTWKICKVIIVEGWKCKLPSGKNARSTCRNPVEYPSAWSGNVFLVLGEWSVKECAESKSELGDKGNRFENLNSTRRSATWMTTRVRGVKPRQRERMIRKKAYIVAWECKTKGEEKKIASSSLRFHLSLHSTYACTFDSSTLRHLPYHPVARLRSTPL